MAFDEKLAARIRRTLAGSHGLAEKKMFGGVCFLLNGHMCCGVVGDTLMLRVGPDGYEDALAEPYAREMDFTGRALRGMVYVAPEGIATERALAAWLARATRFAAGLPRRKK